MSETSGNASIGSVLKAATPPAMKRAVSSSVKSGWCNAEAMSLRIMGGLRTEGRDGGSGHGPGADDEDDAAGARDDQGRHEAD